MQREVTMNKAISIVVPCYNVESYIDRCLTSLVNQTIGIDQLELILVDDASKDKTWDKLVEWESKFPESIIIIQHEKNMKQGAARNTGLQYVSAPYIGFIDADDWADVTMFEKLYNAAIKYNTDITGCNAIRVFTESEKGSIISDQPILYYYDSDEEKTELMKNGITGYVVCWIYRSEIILDNNLMFPQFTAYEDNYWKDILKLYIHSSFLIQEELYYYFVNMNSTIMNPNSMALMDRLSIEERKLKAYSELGIFKLYYQEIEYNFVRLFFINTIYMILTRCHGFPLSMFDYMKKKLVELFPSYKENIYLMNLDVASKAILKLADCNLTQEALDTMIRDYQIKMYSKH